jgi:hypothetical protein
MIFNIELTEDEIEELRKAMYVHLANIEIFEANVSKKRLEALKSLTEKFKLEEYNNVLR